MGFVSMTEYIEDVHDSVCDWRLFNEVRNFCRKNSVYSQLRRKFNSIVNNDFFPKANPFDPNAGHDGCVYESIKHEDVSSGSSNKIFLKHVPKKMFYGIDFFASNFDCIKVYIVDEQRTRNIMPLSSIMNLPKRLDYNGKEVKNEKGQTLYSLAITDYFNSSLGEYYLNRLMIEIVCDDGNLGDIFLNYINLIGLKTAAFDDKDKRIYCTFLTDEVKVFKMTERDVNICCSVVPEDDRPVYKRYRYTEKYNIETTNVFLINEMHFKFEFENETDKMDFDSFDILYKTNDAELKVLTVYRRNLDIISDTEFIYKNFVFYLFSVHKSIIRFNKNIRAKVSIRIRSYDWIGLDTNKGIEYMSTNNEYKYCTVCANVLDM